MVKPSDTEIRLVVAETDEGLRLDAFLATHCEEQTRNRISEDLKTGAVTVDGRHRPKGFRVRAGMEVIYRPTPVRVLTAVAQDIPLNIVYQDEDLLVVDKPSGLVVHPAVGHPDGTLVNALLHQCRDLSAGSHPLRPGIVHRLDRDTSGLLAVALNDAAHQALAAQLEDRTMGRTYSALVWGQWSEDEGKIEGDIGRDPRQRQKMAVLERGGRSAVTRYKVMEDFGFAQLVEARLETGRTHQIRVHFSAHGHPVFGDPVYGDDRRAKGVHSLDRSTADRVVKATKRQFLHARLLELKHPRDGRSLVFESELPADLAAALEILRSAG